MQAPSTGTTQSSTGTSHLSSSEHSLSKKPVDPLKSGPRRVLSSNSESATNASQHRVDSAPVKLPSTKGQSSQGSSSTTGQSSQQQKPRPASASSGDLSTQGSSSTKGQSSQGSSSAK